MIPRHPLAAIVVGYVVFAFARAFVDEYVKARDAARFRRFMSAFNRDASSDPVAEIPAADVYAAVARVTGA